MYIFKHYFFVIAQFLITACICGKDRYKYKTRDERIRELNGVWARNSPAWSWNCKDLIERGDKLLDLGGYDEALTFYKKAVEKKPDEPSYYRLRGRCYQKLYKDEEALHDYQKAILIARKKEFTEEEELRVLDEENLIDLADNLQGKNSEGTIWCYTEALRRNPNKASNYSKRGNYYIKYRKNWDDAISDWKNAKKLDPTVRFVDIFYLAEILYQRGLDETSADDLAFILDDVEFDMIAVRFENKERFKEAVLCYSESIEKSPRDPDYFRKRGICHFKIGNWDEARKDLEENLRLDQTDQKGREYLIKALIRLGKREDALKLAQALTAFELNSFGKDYEKEKEFETAIIFYTEALNKNSRIMTYYIDRGRCHRETGDLDAAITDLRAGLKIDRNNLNGWVQLIEVLHDAGREDETENAIIGMEYLNLLTLGRRFFDKGDYERAISCYDVAIKKDPKRAQAYEDRANSYQKLGKFSKELENLDEFINLSQTPDKLAQLKRAEALVEVEKLDEAKVALKNLETKMTLEKHESRRVAAAREKINKIEFERRNG